MTPTRQGSFRLFRFAGVEVFLHWSWFVIALFAINNRANAYSSFMWNVLEYLALFLVVLLHEFGHALACRSVGGQANEIVLWPFGGVAYVSPPQRPGAMLWSIAAGPLVNVGLLPVSLLLVMLSQGVGWPNTMPDLDRFILSLTYINALILTFNMLPIYPLDGGQILRSLLWYAFGRGRSLMVASIVGFIGVAALFGLALLTWSFWLGLLAGFILMNCWRGLLEARLLARLDQAPRHRAFACPVCRAAPIQGAWWGCARCRIRFDTFVTAARCPQCGTEFAMTRCPECGADRPIGEWVVGESGPPRRVPPGA